MSDDPNKRAADSEMPSKTTSGRAAEVAGEFFRNNAPTDNPNFEPRISLPADAVEAITKLFDQPSRLGFRSDVLAYLNVNARPVSIYKEPGSLLPTYTVFDWVFIGADGREHYARTPENAELLKKAGIKLTAVYTINGAIPS